MDVFLEALQDVLERPQNSHTDLISARIHVLLPKCGIGTKLPINHEAPGHPAYQTNLYHGLLTIMLHGLPH